MGFHEPRRPEARGAATAPRASGPPLLPWSGRLRRARLRRPELPGRALARPRLMARIDDGHRPLTLIVAPAGFGKTIAAAEWAWQEPRAVWVTADAGDASLPRFWAHLREALAYLAPGFGELVDASFAMPLRASGVDLGRMLADELLDAAMPLRLVIDDVHLIPQSETHAFLDGLLEIAPPTFRLVIASRTEPPLSLSRLRLHGAMRELHGADLLFTVEETRALIADANPGAGERAIDGRAAVLWQQTRGWAAGLNLAAIAAEDDAEASAAAQAATGVLLESMLDETLAGRSPGERSALARAALPEAFTTRLVSALSDREGAGESESEAIAFALKADLCRPSPRFGEDWLEFHPVFREGLRRRLEGEETSESLANLHARAAAWFESVGRPGAAIGHRLAAGETDAAIAAVEREIQPAFDREDWPAVARWLALLPDQTIRERLPLLLAQGWLAHLRGQGARLRETLRAIDERLARGDLTSAERDVAQAEMDLMVLGTYLPLQIDPERALVTAQLVLDRVPPARRFQYGNAWTFFALAMQANGRGDDAVERFAWWEETAADRLDAGSIRGRFGLMFVHWQAGNLARVKGMSRTAIEVATRHRLRLATGWSQYVHGNVLYEQDDLDGAIAQYSAVARDYEHLHLVVLRESFFGLAQAFAAAGRIPESWRALRRGRDILLDAGALEHLPVLDAYEAYLALRTGDLARAKEWARGSAVGVDSASLYFVVHPAVIRAAILCAAGDAASLDEAVAVLAEVRQRAAGAYFLGALVRVDALLAIAHTKRGEREEGVAAMRRSLATGKPQGYTRTYLDLLPTFAAEMRQLAAAVEFPDPVGTVVAAHSSTAPIRVALPHPLLPVDSLTERECDVLEALCQRLSYKETAERLFIAPATVKRHASNIYSKLGVVGRNDAIRLAQELGWRP